MNASRFFVYRRCLPLACPMLGLLLLVGCGEDRPRRIPVSGRVLIDGKPLEFGFLQVMQKGNRSASAEIGPGGRFSLATFDEGDGCVLGKHRAVVFSQKQFNSTTLKWFPLKKYASIATSGLEIEVTGPRDDVEIRLSWQGSGRDRPFTEKTRGE